MTNSRSNSQLPESIRNATKGKLTPVKRKFIAEFRKDYNARKAVLRMEFKGKRVDERAYYLRHLPEVEEEIERLVEMDLEEAGVHSKRTLQELARIAYVDLGKAFKEDGSLKDIDELDEDTRAAIASIQTFEEFAGIGEDRFQIGVTRKIKVFDKVKALEILARYQKLLKDDGTGAKKIQVQVLVKGRDVPYDNQPDAAVNIQITEKGGDEESEDQT